jgi:amidase
MLEKSVNETQSRPPIADPLNAFVPDSTVFIQGAPDGPLAGLTFAIKDIFDVAGLVTGGGNPDWARTHEPAASHAPVVQALLDAGATLVGKTIPDELTRGILGINAHYGTPVNPRAPDRVPGGSSSGSAVAVAGGLADFALGSDTGSSVRGPASFCGVYGLRPTHGRIPLEGILKHAPSFDTIGWFADDAEVMGRVGAVLLGSEVADTPLERLVIAADAFELAGDAVTAALTPAIDRVKALAENCDTIHLCPTSFREWRQAKLTEQNWEANRSFAEWIDRTNPRFSYDCALRFVEAAAITEADVQKVEPVRRAHRDRMAELLTPGSFVLLPTTPGPGPLKSLRHSEMQEERVRIGSLGCIADGAGLPQISLPLGEMDGCPLGLSLIGSAGTDEALLGFARKLKA